MSDTVLPQRYELTLEDAVLGAKDWTRRVYLRFAVEPGGEAYGGQIHSAGGLTHALFIATETGLELSADRGRLTGTVATRIRFAGEPVRNVVYSLDAAADSAGAVAGSFTATVDGEPAGGGSLAGTRDTGPLPVPGDCLATLMLHDAVDRDKYLVCYLSASLGRVTHGFATSPRFNHAVHDVDVSALSLSADSLHGALGVRLNPDPWFPADHQPVACVYQLDARLRGAELVGSHQGRFGDQSVAGPLVGHLSAKPGMDQIRGVSWKFEDGLTGGEPWQNRTFISFRCRDGQVVDGTMHNPKSNAGWTGRLLGGSVSFDGETLTADLQGCVDESTSVTPGEYAITLAAQPVGKHLTGTFQTALAGQPLKNGRAAGTIEFGGIQ